MSFDLRITTGSRTRTTDSVRSRSGHPRATRTPYGRGHAARPLQAARPGGIAPGSGTVRPTTVWFTPLGSEGDRRITPRPQGRVEFTVRATR